MSKALTKTVVVTALISFGLSTVSHAQYAGSFAHVIPPFHTSFKSRG